MAPAAARLHGDPTATLRTIGITGTNGKTTTAYLVRALLRGRRASDGAARHRDVGRRRRRARGRPHDAGGDRPAGDVRRDARRRRHALRDGGLQPRARARPRRRDPLGGGDLHEPHPGPPRLPPDDGGLLRRQAQAVRGRAAGRGRSTSTTPTARGWRAALASTRSTIGIDSPQRRPARHRHAQRLRRLDVPRRRP